MGLYFHYFIVSIIKNCLTSWKHIPYTVKHIIAFNKVKKELLGNDCKKYRWHDVDKLFFFILLPFLNKYEINHYHQKNNKHHPTYNDNFGYVVNKKVKDIDFVEAIIDWECARYTKPDKPLNARETLYKFYPQYKEEVEPILDKLGL